MGRVTVPGGGRLASMASRTRRRRGLREAVARCWSPLAGRRASPCPTPRLPVAVALGLVLPRRRLGRPRRGAIGPSPSCARVRAPGRDGLRAPHDLLAIRDGQEPTSGVGRAPRRSPSRRCTATPWPSSCAGASTCPDDLVDRAAGGLRFLVGRPGAHRRRPGHGRAPVGVRVRRQPRWDDWCPGGCRVGRWRAVKGELLDTVERATGGAPIGNPELRVASAGFNALVAWNVRELASVTDDDGLSPRPTIWPRPSPALGRRPRHLGRRRRPATVGARPHHRRPVAAARGAAGRGDRRGRSSTPRRARRPLRARRASIDVSRPTTPAPTGGGRPGPSSPTCCGWPPVAAGVRRGRTARRLPRRRRRRSRAWPSSGTPTPGGRRRHPPVVGRPGPRGLIRPGLRRRRGRARRGRRRRRASTPPRPRTRARGGRGRPSTSRWGRIRSSHARQPPVGVAEQAHRGRHQDRPGRWWRPRRRRWPARAPSS